MRKSMLVCTILAGACWLTVSAKADDKGKESPEAAEKSAASAPVAVAAPAPAETPAGDKKEAPELIAFDKAKLGVVQFTHKLHAEKLGGCAACHEGKEPLFAQKMAGGFKMADMYAGKGCGSCHNGKEMPVGKEKKVVFAAKGACMKCHKKKA